MMQTNRQGRRVAGLHGLTSTLAALLLLIATACDTEGRAVGPNAGLDVVSAVDTRTTDPDGGGDAGPSPSDVVAPNDAAVDDAAVDDAVGTDADAELADVADIVDADVADVVDAQADVFEDVVGDAVADVEPPPEWLVGQFNLLYWAPDAIYGWPEVFANGVFSPQLAEGFVENAVSWINEEWGYSVFAGDGYWQLPLEGEWYELDGYPNWEPNEDVETLDGGPYVVLGDEVILSREERIFELDDVVLYGSDPEDSVGLAERQPMSDPLALEIAGGADISAITLPGAALLPEPIVFTSHDPSQPLAMRYGDSPTFTWEPSDDPDDIVFFSATDMDVGYIIGVPDADGRLDPLDYVDPDTAYVGGYPNYTLTRMRWEVLQLAEGRLSVVMSSRSMLYGVYVGPYELDRTVIPQGETVDIVVLLWDWAFDADTMEISFGPWVDLESVDVSEDLGAMRLDLTVSVPQGAPTGPVDATVVGSDGTQLLFIEDLLTIAAALPVAGECESVWDEGSVADGTYRFSDEGLPARDYDPILCDQDVPRGREQAIPIQLEAGQRLRARATGDRFNAVAYLLESCQEEGAALACSTSPEHEAWAEVQHAAYADTSLLLFVDSYMGEDAEPSDFVVDIQRTAPAPFLLEPEEIVQGETATLTLRLIEPDGTVESLEPAALQLGEGLEVTAVRALGDGVFELDVAVAVDAASGWRTATLTAADTALVTEEAVRVWQHLPMAIDFDEADALGPLAPGRYVGTTDLDGWSQWEGIPCLADEANGPEAVYRVEVGASETVTVHARMPESDVAVYLLSEDGVRILACADNTMAGRPEYLAWTAPAEATTAYLVVDGYWEDDAGEFWLEVEVKL